MEHLVTATLTQLPQVRALGRHTGRDPLTLFWTASGMELEFTGSELWVDLFADYEVVEPWVSFLTQIIHFPLLSSFQHVFVYNMIFQQINISLPVSDDSCPIISRIV